jgi:nucleobase transporter 1/2
MSQKFEYVNCKIGYQETKSVYKFLSFVLDKSMFDDLLCFFLQYLHRYIKTVKPIHDRFAVLFTVAIAWLFALLLTSSTAYNHKSESTQKSCRTDRAGLLSSAPW